VTHVTRRLTAKNRDQLRNPTLGNPVWATFTFFTTINGASGDVLTAITFGVCGCAERWASQQQQQQQPLLMKMVTIIGLTCDQRKFDPIRQMAPIRTTSSWFLGPTVSRSVQRVCRARHVSYRSTDRLRQTTKHGRQQAASVRCMRLDLIPTIIDGKHTFSGAFLVDSMAVPGAGVLAGGLAVDTEAPRRPARVPGP